MNISRVDTLAMVSYTKWRQHWNDPQSENCEPETAYHPCVESALAVYRALGGWGFEIVEVNSNSANCRFVFTDETQGQIFADFRPGALWLFSVRDLESAILDRISNVDRG